MKQLVILVLIVSLLIAGVAFAETRNKELSSVGSGYGLGWWTVDGGGGAASTSDGQYALTGTVGQADAGASSDSQYGLVVGFWGTRGQTEYLIYLPLVLRDMP